VNASDVENTETLATTQAVKSATPLFYDLYNLPISHYSVWSIISAHNLTPLKHHTCVQTEYVVDHGREINTFEHRLLFITPQYTSVIAEGVETYTYFGAQWTCCATIRVICCRHTTRLQIFVPNLLRTNLLYSTLYNRFTASSSRCALKLKSSAHNGV